MSDAHIQGALEDFIKHIGENTPRAKRIRNALKEGMYPPKYIYLLITAGQM